MSQFDKQVGGSHYQKFKIQPTVFLQANQDMIGWCEANAIKYACRHRFKNGRQDIEKAIHYLKMILEIDYPEVGDDEDYKEKLLRERNIARLHDLAKKSSIHYAKLPRTWLGLPEDNLEEREGTTLEELNASGCTYNPDDEGCDDAEDWPRCRQMLKEGGLT